MSWETRNKNKIYYYRSHRVDGKLVRQFYGRGPIAKLFAQSDERAASQLRAERAQLGVMQQEFERLELIIDRQEKLLNLLIRAHLIVAGYYNHKGQWRKRRAKFKD